MLELLAKNHKMWIKMLIDMGCRAYVAEDIVQSMYLRLHKYVKDEKKIMYKNDEVNRFFVYVTLKNMFFSYKKAANKYTFLEIREDEVVVDEDVAFIREEAMEIAFDRLMIKVDNEMNTWHKYDRILSEKYLKSDYSLRDIASGSGISLTSIFNSMRENKRILREKFSEDWEDFKNGDYNLI
jgi:DNA-directed RNA polymerase specialized sigma24 family protein